MNTLPMAQGYRCPDTLKVIANFARTRMSKGRDQEAIALQ
jgi:hypothetical protein